MNKIIPFDDYHGIVISRIRSGECYNVYYLDLKQHGAHQVKVTDLSLINRVSETDDPNNKDVCLLKSMALTEGKHFPSCLE